MPGRVSVRAARQAKTSKPRAAGQGATNIPDEGPPTTLREQICDVFGNVQKSATGQRKLVVRLRRVQEACCYEPTQTTVLNDYDEEQFNAEVGRCVLRVLPIKKGEPVGDRIVKFLGLFLRYATDADNAIFADETLDAPPETPSSRLTSHIISAILPLLTTKDKIVRFRCTQIVAHLTNTLDSVEDELFHHIRIGLIKRLRDKESIVRMQAVYGLGRLAGEADEEEMAEESDDEDTSGIIEKLLDILQNDPSSEVRRAILLNLPFTPSTLPFLLERARDLDASIRRALYSRLLPALGDFRHLSLTHREKLLRWGLRDRDENVKKATARLFRERWIEDCTRIKDEEGNPIDTEVPDPSLDGLLELLERIDVVNVGVDGGVALDAMKEFWEGRPDYCDYIAFDQEFWKTLTPESVFVARTFNDHCRSGISSDSLSDKIPEATRFAYLIQENVNTLIETVRAEALQDEENSAQQEFIVEQLLQISLTLDYSDEVGRRAMFSLIREVLALPELPEETTRLAMDALRLTCSSEKEFCGVVLEAIAEVHDTIMGDDRPEESFHSAQSELEEKTPEPLGAEPNSDQAVREIMVNMKCLHIAQCMLQNVDCSLEQNTHLVTMLNNLVVPAVRSQEAPIRERGLVCLGLCCLLDKNLAEENLTLFLHCFTKGHDALQNIAVQIIGDVLSAHPTLLFATQDESELAKPLQKLFSKGLKSPSAVVQSTTCTTLCKLLLTTITSTSILNGDELLRQLAIAYFNPETASNAGMRQALSYFFPVYCHSRRENMQRLGRIALSVLSWCLNTKEDMDVEVEQDPGEMVGLAVVVAHLVDWTDGRKLVQRQTRQESFEPDGNVHLDLGAEALTKLMGVCSREERRVYVSLLGKIHIGEASDSEKLSNLLRLTDEAIEEKIADDATTRNTLQRLQAALNRAVSTLQPVVAPQMTALDETGVYPSGESKPTDQADSTPFLQDTPDGRPVEEDIANLTLYDTPKTPSGDMSSILSTE